ncbi:MAG TPA: 23S rRNA (guanosine(2251)-2'-O)-methyltransferase RlmB [Aggregatilineaceae bacterium]|nr:23S rRNA (guanosine(2251)-2'-O)-methyltransferase RlmB [Aggregatilineaceae bacterium]
MSEYLYGRWSVLECLQAGRRNVEQLLLAEGVDEKGNIETILNLVKQRNINLRRVPRRVIDDLSKDANHQGVALRVGVYPYVELDDILAHAAEKGEKPFLLVLDLLKDPQNVGALLRVSDAVGIHGILLQERRGVDVTPAVVNASSGAVEHLNVSIVNNLVTAMRRLKEEDVWLVGLDIGPETQTLDQVDLDRSIALVMGSEGEGLRRLVRETCDMRITLPMRGHVQSLNVATAGSIALYAAWQARSWQGWVPAPTE